MANPSSILDYERIDQLGRSPEPSAQELKDILDKARLLKGLEDPEAASLLAVTTPEARQAILEAAAFVKSEIYGARMVLFAPLYAGNKCSNDCLYCGFRRTNKDLTRITLNRHQIEEETRALLAQGHKRLLLLTGETGAYGLDYMMDALDAIYSVREKGANIRRVNVEVAPMSVDDFKVLKTGNIGTYTCFQETYDPTYYAKYHVAGPKANYLNRLTVMDRAMEAGIDDVGLGVLFGLAPWRQEVISMLDHARHLEKRWGCGPHTVSVPRLEPAHGAPISSAVPHPVNDDDFRLLVAVLRLTLPYTGIILSTRESVEMRNSLFRYGVSQVSAGSRTEPGGYQDAKESETFSHSQFSLADHRSLHQMVSDLVDGGFVPSFCTGCYRMGRTGADFMDLAKPGLIKCFCLPNGLSSFAEYLEEYADDSLKTRGYATIDRLANEAETPEIRQRIIDGVSKVRTGGRDIYV